MTSSKRTTSLALFLALNLLFFNLAAAACGGCPSPRPGGGPGGRPGGGPGGRPGGGPGGGPGGRPGGGPGGRPGGGPGTSGGACPRDALKLGICADVLGSLLNITIGTPPVQPCCSLIQGLVDLEAAICLCTAIRANILGINLNIPLSLSLLLNVCSRRVPRGFVCN